MRFFTRRLRESSQDSQLDPDDNAYEQRCEEADRIASEVSLQYLEYLQIHDHQLTDSVRKLVYCPLHDARIEQAQNEDGVLKLVLDTKDADMNRFDAITLIFLNVREASGISQLQGQIILDTEVYIRADGSFEFSALGHRTEAHFQFEDITILTT